MLTSCVLAVAIVSMLVGRVILAPFPHCHNRQAQEVFLRGFWCEDSWTMVSLFIEVL